MESLAKCLQTATKLIGRIIWLKAIEVDHSHRLTTFGCEPGECRSHTLACFFPLHLLRRIKVHIARHTTTMTHLPVGRMKDSRRPFLFLDVVMDDVLGNAGQVGPDRGPPGITTFTFENLLEHHLDKVLLVNDAMNAPAYEACQVMPVSVIDDRGGSDTPSFTSIFEKHSVVDVLAGSHSILSIRPLR